MSDGSNGGYRLERRRVQSSAQRKKKWLRGALSVGIAVCLLITTILMTSKEQEGLISVSAVSFSANDTTGDAERTGSIFEDSLINPRLILGTEMPVIYGVNLEEVSRQESGRTEQPEINFDVIPENIKMEILKFSSDTQQQYTVKAQGPQILIYHTHTREAYLEEDVSVYNVGQWQTTQQSHSVVAVGEVLKAELESYGFSVIHDMTDHVPPDQDTAYERSLQTMLDYQERYPTLRVFIDLHRDAGSNTEDYVTIEGKKCARMMFVVGTDENSSYESDYKLALALTNQLEAIKEGLMHPVRIKTGRYTHYNQQVSDMCLLLEVGHNSNTLEQAKNSVGYFALALSRVVDIGSQ